MLGNCKFCFQRVVAVPSIRTSYNVVKYYSDKSGDNNEEGKNYGNQFHNFCLGCSCPSGCDPKITCYDARKYGHCLPGYTNCPNFDILPHIPSDIFRCTAGERLGPQGQAGKCCQYLNPEYFSFHHMSYYDMHYMLRAYRNRCPDTGRKPT